MDKTMDVWPRRLIYLGIAVLMTLGLLLAPAMAPQASAADVDAEWKMPGTPNTDDWTVAPGAKISVPAVAPGGEVIYVVGKGYDDNDWCSGNYTARLWKSEDSGVVWDDLTDKVWDADSLPAAFKDKPNVSFNYVACGRDEGGHDFVAVALVNTSAITGPTDYCNMSQAVVISADGGDNFYWTRDMQDGYSTLNMAFSMVVSDEDADDTRNIAVGGVGMKNASCVGLVYRYETGGLIGGGWVDASDYEDWDLGMAESKAVTKVAFAPSWLEDKTVMAVSHTSDDTYLQTGTWGNTKVWNSDLEGAVLVAEDESEWATQKGAAAGLTLPRDYENSRNSRYAWVYVNGHDNATGVIYRVVGTQVEPLDKQISDEPYLASINYLGYIESGKALAGLYDGEGCCQGVQVYRNDGIAEMAICCDAWKAACKPPTGTTKASVGYVSIDKAYAFVGGDTDYAEGAMSFSYDDGDNWNQIGLVDTYIDYLSDVAKSPKCNKTWVVSVNLGGNMDAGSVSLLGRGPCECDSVWLHATPLPEASEYSAAWVRVWSDNLTYNEGLNSCQTPEMGLLRLAPEETEEALTVYLVDRGTNKVYYESSEGLGCWEPGKSTVDNITDFAVQDEATIYTLDFNADVAVSENHGKGKWSSAMDTKVDDGHTIAVLGEGNVLVGGADGKVSYSDDDLATFADGEASFTDLQDGLGKGRVHVAFDSYFDSNSVIYAAVSVVNVSNDCEDPDNDADNGIYRWEIGESSEWTDLGKCKTLGTTSATPWGAQLGYDTDMCDKVEVGYYGIVLSNAEGNPETDATTGGVLYATFYDANGNVTGVARCLNPAEDVACGGAEWDYLIEDVSDMSSWPIQFTLEPSNLKICGCLTPDTYSQLYAIDDHPYYRVFACGDVDEVDVGTLNVYEDCYAKAGPTLLSPADGDVVDADPCYCWNDAFTLKWDRQCDACSYNLQIALDEGFTEVMSDHEWIGKDEDDCTEIDYDPPKGSAPSYVVGNNALGEGSCGTTYYWRVRSADAETGEIIHSPWSEVRSFTVAVGPMAQLTLTNPANGAIGVAVSNIPFTWDAVADATGYEFSLMNAATDVAEESWSGSETTHTYTGTLSYSTSYYWTVKAFKGTTAFGDATATGNPSPPNLVVRPFRVVQHEAKASQYIFKLGF